MQIGVALPTMARGYTRSTTLDWCRGIDEGPFSSISCGERITFQNQEMNVTNSAAAALTERVRVFVNLVVLPMAFLSGVFFQIDAMPEVVQQISWLMPMRHLSAGMLDVLVRDGGVGSVVAPVGVLLGFAAVVTLVATRVFSWED